jgi:hypothetical protein
MMLIAVVACYPEQRWCSFIGLLGQMYCCS